MQKSILISLSFEKFIISILMFPGFDEDDNEDMIYLIQAEAKSLVDSVLEESVDAVTSDTSAFVQSSSVRFEKHLTEIDEQPMSYELSNEDSSIGQQNFQLQLNNFSNNPSDQAHLSEMSDNFAIKSDYGVIVKSPTIESGMSGKDFEDVDDDYNMNGSSFNNVYVSKIENSSTVIENSSILQNVHDRVVDVNESYILPEAESEANSSRVLNDEQLIQHEAKTLVDTVIKDTIEHFDDIREKSSDDANQQISNNELKDIFNVQGENSFRHEHNK